MVRVPIGTRARKLRPGRQGNSGRLRRWQQLPSWLPRQHKPSSVRDWELPSMINRRRPFAAPFRRILVAAVLTIAAGIGALPFFGVMGQATPIPSDFTIHELPTLGGDAGSVVEINEAGIAVGWSELRPGAVTAHATVWAGGDPVDLGTLGGNSQATDINDDGIVAGYAETAEGQR